MSRHEALSQLSAPTVAILLERGLLESWPLELTRRGRLFLNRAPDTNIWRNALIGVEKLGIRERVAFSEIPTAPVRKRIPWPPIPT